MPAHPDDVVCIESHSDVRTARWRARFIAMEYLVEVYLRPGPIGWALYGPHRLLGNLPVTEEQAHRDRIRDEADREAIAATEPEALRSADRRELLEKTLAQDGGGWWRPGLR